MALVALCIRHPVWLMGSMEAMAYHLEQAMEAVL